MSGVTMITLLIVLAVAALALCLRPAHVVGVIIMAMLLWPEYLRVPVGPVQMSAPRMGALVLVCRMILSGRGNGLRWTMLDSLVCVVWVWDVFANVIMGADETQLVSMVGRVLDTVLMYFAARLALRDAADFRALVVPAVVTAALMGALGAMEAITAWSPYESLYAYGGHPWFDKGAEFRFGFLRAKGSASHAIYFGLAMTLLVGLLWSLRGFAKHPVVAWVGCGAAFVGALSSLSSGPQVALVTLMICGAFLYFPWAIKPAAACLVVLCLLVEATSHRHFYQLIDYLALSSETAWYRGRLIEVAVERVSDYGACGVGAHWPHHWGMLIDTRQHVDVVNHYIIVALYGGLPSLALYLASLVLSFVGCARVASRHPDRKVQMLAFGLCCTLAALMAACMSIGLFGPPLALSYLLIGSMVSVAVRFPAARARERRAPALALTRYRTRAARTRAGAGAATAAGSSA